ncbi:MAG: MFS transporter [Deltaproteobacteria bacterium]|nr:MFS transporter [Deltaproteobacteria bacterium]
MNATASKTPRYAALQHKNFVLLWSGMIVSNIGTWVQNVAQGWLVLQLTDSPLWLGVLGLSFAVPMVLLPLVGGAVVDRINRIRLLFFTQTAMMMLSFAVALLIWFDLIRVWHLLAASFMGAALLAFDNPARRALIPDIVPPQDLMNALSINAATYTGAALIGPAIAGALLVPLGIGSLFFLNGISYLAVLIALMAMRDAPTHSGGIQASFAESVIGGLAYAWRTRLILALLIISALTAICGRSYQNLFPIFARDIWRSGAHGYGFLLSAAGGGAVVGAFGLASIRQLKRQGAVMIGCGLVFSAAVILFSISTSLIMGICFIFIGGVMATVFGTIIATFIQIMVPGALRGRIMSLYTITLIGLPSLGGMGIGAIAELLGGIPGAPRAVWIGGAVVAALFLSVSPFFWRRNIA